MRYTLFVLLLCCNIGFAQNLVPNPSFEGYNACPFNHTNIDYSPGYNVFPYVQAWVSPTESSPDYFNSCSGSGSPVNVPDNLWGYQVAHTGTAYTGMYYWISGSDYREYLQTKLNQPMQAGRQYYVSMYVSNTVPGFAAGVFNVVGIYDIGIHISATHNTSPGISPMYLPAQITQPTGDYLVDTMNWVKVKGIYTATGGEEWVTIGNFYNGTNVPYTIIAPEPDTNYLCYMYMDDVNVSAINDTIITIHDTAICSQNFPVTLYGPPHNTDISLWNTGDTSANITINTGSTYWKFSWNDNTLFIDSFIVTAPTGSTLTLDLGPDTALCSNALTISADKDFLSYSWNTGATTKSIVVSASGQYILNAVDSCGGTVSDTINVTIKPIPSAPVANDTVVCINSNVLLTVSGQNIFWFTNPNGTGTPVQPVINTSTPGEQILYLSQTVDGCESPQSDVKITVTDKPVRLGNTTHSICNGESITVGQAQENVSYLWSTDETACCINVSQPGTYSVTMQNNCGAVSDTVSLTTYNCTNCIVVPTAFTPNSDGRNDVYTVKARCGLQRYHIGIFNRFGELVYESNDITESWNGMYNNELTDVGVYFFYIKYVPEIPNAKEELVKGDITVIR